MLQEARKWEYHVGMLCKLLRCVLYMSGENKKPMSWSIWSNRDASAYYPLVTTFPLACIEIQCPEYVWLNLGSNGVGYDNVALNLPLFLCSVMLQNMELRVT